MTHDSMYDTELPSAFIQYYYQFKISNSPSVENGWWGLEGVITFICWYEAVSDVSV